MRAGFGASSIVHLATYSPIGSSGSSTYPPEPVPCAVKIIDVDKLSRAGDIDRLRRCAASFRFPFRTCQLQVHYRRETQLMALSKHPNVLRVRGEWIEGSKLFIACRYMSPGPSRLPALWVPRLGADLRCSGSLLDISKYAFLDGFDEIVIATALKQALEG